MGTGKAEIQIYRSWGIVHTSLTFGGLRRPSIQGLEHSVEVEVSGEIDRASAGGHQSAQWEICGPKGTDGKHPQWGEVSGRVEIYERRTWNAPVEALSTLVQNSPYEHKTSPNRRLKLARGCGL